MPPPRDTEGVASSRSFRRQPGSSSTVLPPRRWEERSSSLLRALPAPVGLFMKPDQNVLQEEQQKRDGKKQQNWLKNQAVCHTNKGLTTKLHGQGRQQQERAKERAS